MALTPQDVDAEVASWTFPADKTAEPHPLATPAGTPPDPIAAAQTPPPAQVTPSYLDGVLSFADKYKSRVHDIFEASSAMMPFNRPVRDLATGAIKYAVNTVDSVASAAKASGAGLAAAEDPAHAEEALNGPDPSHPVYDAARGAVLAMRDAIAVKDPGIADNLIQGFGQFAGPFAMYSRVLGSFGTAAELAGGSEAALTSFGSKVATAAGKVGKFAAADAATNATANAPHDPRTADLLSLHNTAEGKFHDILNAVSPDGSLVRHYLDYIASPDVSEADGRFKNVLDGFNIATALTGALHVGAGTLRAGWGALHHMADNNMGSMGDLMPANQEGKIGYHGTATSGFSEFDNSKIGSGQGAQSYGYGHYIAENATTGETYQKALAGRAARSAPLQLAQQAVKEAGGDAVKAFKTLDAQYDKMRADGSSMTDRGVIANAQKLIKNGNYTQGAGALLKVDIDEGHINNMLDLDTSMEKQPDVLNKIPYKDQKQLQAVLDDHGQDLTLGELTGNEFRQLIERAYNERYLQPSTKSLYGTAVNPAGDASSYLSGRGIPGNKYFDKGSRIAGEGTRNFVVFDGKHIKVLGKEK